MDTTTVQQSFTYFDIESVDESIVGDTIDFDKDDIKKNLTLFLYPDDSDDKGRLLRVYQQYFMVSNAARLILQRQRQRALIYMTLLIMQQFRSTIHIHQWLFQSLSVSFRRRAS